jgi:tryptophan 2-monooxygenase
MERYWETSNIPQIIVTDTILQGVYGLAVETKEQANPGVILISYTWEDDATKLVADEDSKLAQLCLARLDQVLGRCNNIKTNMSQYVDTEAPKVHHWERLPSYRGCARLYRQGSWDLASHLYFAGEAYSVEGGWVEPALRSALDAVMHIVKNTRGRFGSKEFRFTRDYPKYMNPSHQKRLSR